ncbi:shikimate dehydrogenase [Gammaproteobacteria bacterium]|nr:shikimate dehydrogenase [Gammaproteobacteria bacterium]
MSNPARFAVIGNPITHSRSPEIHAAFAQQLAIDLDYRRLLAAEGDFDEVMRAFFDQGGRGLNVTLPFKAEALAAADVPSSRAQLAGAANTLWRDAAGRLCADNTDGVGFVRDLRENHGQAISDRRVLIIGAGGATRGLLQPLIEAGAASITIANRTVAKAQALVDCVDDPSRIGWCALDEASGHFDILINATSAGLSAALPAIRFDHLIGVRCAADLIYGEGAKPFVGEMRRRGVPLVFDGLGMLIEQAAESFAIWHGQRPDTAELIRSMAT